MIETRQVADSFAEKLIQNKEMDDENDVEAESRPVFAYSLFYVYYDQYTYIKGVLFEDTLLAIAAVVLSIEIITNLGISLFVGLCVFLVSFNLLGLLWVSNILISGFKI